MVNGSKIMNDTTQQSRFLNPAPGQFDYIILSDLRSAIEKHAGKITGEALDYGCGVRPYEPLFPEVTKYTGADLPGNAAADIDLGPDGSLPPEAGPFDAVVSFQVLEHAPDPAAYLAACRRALKPGGKLLLTTHGIWEYHPTPEDHHRWTHHGLRRLIESAGFETIAIEPVTTGMRGVLQLHALLVRDKFKPKKLRAPLIRFINWLGNRYKNNDDMERAFAELPLCYIYYGKSINP